MWPVFLRWLSIVATFLHSTFEYSFMPCLVFMTLLRLFTITASGNINLQKHKTFLNFYNLSVK